MTKKGYKQTPEHIAKRIGKEETHARWIGDRIAVKSGRSRALRKYPDIGPCVSCGDEKPERHHIDGNTANNDVSNIRALCRRCHMKEDGRLSEFANLSKSSLPKAIEVAAKTRRERTECKNGHPLSGENVRMRGNTRLCRACQKQYRQNWSITSEKENGNAS